MLRTPRCLGNTGLICRAGETYPAINRSRKGYSVVGFPDGIFSYPSFSNGYPENGMPAYYESVSRSVNGYFNTGYAF